MDLERRRQAREQDQEQERQHRRDLRARKEHGEDDAGQHDDRDDVPACARGQVPQQGDSSIATESDFRFVVAGGAAGVRLDRFLAEPAQLGSRRRASLALERGKVFVNDAEVTPADAGRRVKAGDRVRVWMDRPGSARRRWGRPSASPGALQIVYEDSALIVVNKPAGLLTVPLPRRGDEPNVEEQLAVHLRTRGKRRPLVVHRIDRDTSGLVVFATRSDAQFRLKEQFRRHEPERVYLAVVYGQPAPAAGTWRDRLVWDQAALIQKETHQRDPRGKDAVSEYRVLERFARASLVEVRLKTGKRNQIRLQARLRGHMLVGEQRYIYGPDALREIEFPRQALHSHRLAFRHPVTAQQLSFEAPLPSDMAELIARLRIQTAPSGV
jgi:23S rRNA pseudouridine1911/1915/1917 synthase